MCSFFYAFHISEYSKARTTVTAITAGTKRDVRESDYEQL